MKQSKNIVVLTCGGTIAMTQEGGRGLAINGQESTDIVERLIASADPNAHLRVREVMAVDSTDMGPSDWQVICDVISLELSTATAIIVLCGTNTMGYLASALAFALRGISIPVVVTGSLLPANLTYSDASANFSNSIRFAELGCRGVYVVFRDRVILGCRAKKVSESAYDAFCTFNATDFAQIGLKMHVQSQVPKQENGEFKVRGSFCPNVVSVTVLPGLSTEALIRIIDDTQGLILRSFGAGDLPRRLFPALRHAAAKQVPVVNTTQCRGATIMGLNEIGREALEFGVVQAFDMSMEAMSAKLMWLLGQDYDYDEIRRLMQIDLVGEIKVPDEIRTSD